MATEQTTTTRRTFITAAAALASPVAAIPALGAVTGPLDPVLALAPAWREARDAYAIFLARMAKAHDLGEAICPSVPEVLYETEQDCSWGFPEAGGIGQRPAGEERQYYTGGTVKRLCRDMQVGFPFPFGPEKRRRVEEIAAAWEAHVASTKATEAASGYSEDGPEEMALMKCHDDMVYEVTAAPAVTLAGLAFKAVVAAHVADAGGDTLLERIEEDLARAQEWEGMTAGMVGLSIVRDLLRMAGGAAHG